MNKKKMQLPLNCKKLTLDEMMQNESGWYVNLQTGEMMVTYTDVEKAIAWVTSFMDQMNPEADGTEIATEFLMANGLGCMRRHRNTQKSLMAPEGGIGIRVSEAGCSIFTLKPEDMEKANSNTFIF